MRAVLLHIGFPFVVKHKIYYDLRFELKNCSESKSLFYCWKEGKKKNKTNKPVRHQWASRKMWQGIYFPFCSCVCPLIFSFLKKSSGNPKLKQLMLCSTWWLNLIWLFWRWTDNSLWQKTFCSIWKGTITKNAVTLLCYKISLNYISLGSGAFISIWNVLTVQK